MLLADRQAGRIEPHFEALAEADEGITRQALAALHALQQEARIERPEFGECRHRGVEVSGDVKGRFHRVFSVSNSFMGDAPQADNKKPISGLTGDGFFWYSLFSSDVQ